MGAIGSEALWDRLGWFEKGGYTIVKDSPGPQRGSLIVELKAQLSEGTLLLVVQKDGSFRQLED